MFRWFRSSRRKPRPQRQATRSRRLFLEALEDRLMPSVSIDAFVVPDSAREGEEAAFSAYASGSAGAALNYHWDFGDGTSANGTDLTNPTHVYVADPNAGPTTPYTVT